MQQEEREKGGRGGETSSGGTKRFQGLRRTLCDFLDREIEREEGRGPIEWAHFEVQSRGFSTLGLLIRRISRSSDGRTEQCDCEPQE